MASVKKRKWTYKGADKTAWVVRWQEGGKHRSKQFEKKKDADAYRVKVEGLEASGAGLIDSTITVGKVCDLFMNLQEERLSDGRIGRATMARKRGMVCNLIVPELSSIAFSELKSFQLEALYSKLVKERRLKPQTARSAIGLMSGICDFAVKHGFAPDNVAREALRSLRGIAPPEIATFNEVEIRQLLTAAMGRPRGCRERSTRLLELAVNLAAFSGLRYGEILGLTRSCLDHDRRLIRVQHSLTAWDEHKAPKTRAGKRDLPAAEHVWTMLTDWLARHYIENPRQLLFRSSTGGFLKHGNFTRQWIDLQTRAEVTQEGAHRHFHALRHFCASWMVANGMPITDVAKMLGHSRFDVTLQTYAHPLQPQDAINNAVRAMSRNLVAVA